MNIILVPCSNKKEAGGTTGEYKSSTIQNRLSYQSHKDLMAARVELAELLGYSTGHDLGFEVHDQNVPMLPAYKRYSGIIFTKAEVGKVFPKSSSVLVIVSALYGLLDANDLIRNYDLTMSYRLPAFRFTVQKFWSNFGLGRIIKEYCEFQQYEMIHDLLTNPYRKALAWPVSEQNPLLREYNFPGQGMGALFRRGEILRELLVKDI